MYGCIIQFKLNLSYAAKYGSLGFQGVVSLPIRVLICQPTDKPTFAVPLKS